MNKPNHRKLVLQRSTIRTLSSVQLAGAAGGSLISTDFDACVSSGCTKDKEASGCRAKPKKM